MSRLKDLLETRQGLTRREVDFFTDKLMQQQEKEDNQFRQLMVKVKRRTSGKRPIRFMTTADQFVHEGLDEMDVLKAAVKAVNAGTHTPSQIAPIRNARALIHANKSHPFAKSPALMGAIRKVYEDDIEKAVDRLLESKSNVEQIAKRIGAKDIDLNQLKKGIEVEKEHGPRDKQTDVVGKGSPETYAKIALAHLKEIPDYYTRLDKMEKQGKEAIKEAVDYLLDEGWMRGLSERVTDYRPTSGVPRSQFAPQQKITLNRTQPAPKPMQPKAQKTGQRVTINRGQGDVADIPK